MSNTKANVCKLLLVATCINVNSTNSEFYNKRNFVAWFNRKLFTMTRKFNPENLNFLGTCFSLMSLRIIF